MALLEAIPLKALLESISRDPNDYETYNALGIHYASIDPVKAFRCFQRAIDLNPDYAIAFYNLANVLRNIGSLDSAIQLYQRAIELDPSIYQAYFNTGSILLEGFNYERAKTLFKKALEANPDYPEALTNLGVCYYNQGAIGEATACYEKAIKLYPDYADAHFNLALALLMLGDYQRGWAEYRWRWRSSQFKPHCYEKPLWDGSNISDKRLLVYTEQGYGDTLQFVRYLGPISKICEKVILQVPTALKTLIAHSFVDVEITDLAPPLDDYELCCPLMDLPFIFNTTLESVPNDIPYLWPSNEAIEKASSVLRILGDNRLKIGILWRGSRLNKRGYYRSINYNDLLPILELPNISFVSLMIDSEGPHRHNLLDISAHIRDFNDTAGFIANLDLVITIDTAVAHLAGAMGKSVWLMLHHISDWRWLLDRCDSLWYPSMEIFRQTKPNEWQGVIEGIKNRLIGQYSLYRSSISAEELYREALTLRDSRKDNEAIGLLREAITIKPDYAEAHFDLALLLLKNQDLKEGWTEYEWRRHLPISLGCYPTLPLPELNGKDLAGRSVLLYDEQGFGDAIQFVRFIGRLRERGTRAIYLLCQPKLSRLMGCFDGIDAVFTRGIDFSVNADYIAPLMSLPLYLGVTIDELHTNAPYFNIKNEDILLWDTKLASKNKAIGLCWSGRPTHLNDKNRSMSFECLLPLLDIEAVDFYSLQKGASISHPRLIDLTPIILDFYDTAGLISNLDMVITVDTAVAHLAGALNIETWLMLPYNADWRWFKNTDSTVWYESVKIFRQPSYGDWPSVIRQVAEKLSVFISS